MANAAIAAEKGVHVDTVRKWRARFCTDRLQGMADRPRSGRPPVYTPLQVAEVKALACEPPANSGLPLSRWSHAELAGQARDRGIMASSRAPEGARRFMSHDWSDATNSYPRLPVPEQPPQDSQRFPSTRALSDRPRTLSTCGHKRPGLQ